MIDSFTLAIPDDPAPCLAAADGLRALARSTEEAADHLDTQVLLPSDDFSGVTAQAYRAACGDLRSDVLLLARDVRGLADALVDYVGGIEDVRRVLQQVGRRAVAEGLQVSGAEIRRPECPDPAQDEAFVVLLGLKNRAHLAAGWVYSDWMAALERHTGAVPTGTIAYPPLGAWPPQPGDDPYDAGGPRLGPGSSVSGDPPASPGGQERPDRPDRHADDRPHAPAPPRSAPAHTGAASAPAPSAGPATPGSDPRDVPFDPHPMIPASVAPLPDLLLPDPAAHGRCPDAFEGVLT